MSGRIAMRLGVYNDDVYRVSEIGGETRVSADRAFLLFACHVGEHFDGLALLGRTVRTDAPADYLLPVEVELLELPYYEDLFDLRRLVRVFGGTVRGMWRAAGQVDCVWVLGPHPFAFPLVAVARARGRRVALGVRYDALSYYRARLPSRRWTPAVLVVRLLDVLFRLLARRLPTTVVGPHILRHYGRRPTVLETTVSLVREAEVAAKPPERNWSGPLQLLAIGRLDREKNPLLAVEALAELERRRPGRYSLVWVGRGPLRDQFESRARELGVDGALELRGYVPFGPALRALYEQSHVLVHTSLTEGLPQVLVEALAFGTPVVGTDVGGVGGALAGGAAGLLVPPRDRDALVNAVLRLSDDEGLRDRLTEQGLALARENTLEVQAERVARFIAGEQVTA
jgi:glycosyltransferase involved in cell wall biosynthesis